MGKEGDSQSEAPCPGPRLKRLVRPVAGSGALAEHLPRLSWALAWKKVALPSKKLTIELACVGV